MAHEERVSLLDYRGAQTAGLLIGIADQCPRCHRHVRPNLRVVALADGYAEALFHCTSGECQHTFISRFKATGTVRGGIGPMYEYEDSIPVAPASVSFPDEVAAVSPTFVLIYNQAMEAESNELDQLVGIGLRKALEFLIKDFCISERPADASNIKAVALATCIENYVTDSMVKQVAKRAVWLGNDETHYVRKWVAKDIDDLKTLVKLTVNWIDSSITTKKYLDEMTAAGPGPAPATQ